MVVWVEGIVAGAVGGVGEARESAGALKEPRFQDLTYGGVGQTSRITADNAYVDLRLIVEDNGRGLRKAAFGKFIRSQAAAARSVEITRSNLEHDKVSAFISAG